MKTTRYFITGFIALFLAFFQNAFGQTTQPQPSQLINLSCRGKVRSGNNILTLGFVVIGINGNLSTRIMVRAVGQSLGAAPFNVPNAASDTRIAVFEKGGRRIGENDNWGSEGAAVQNLMMQTAANVGAFPLIIGSRDSVVILNVEPGDYTAQISGIAADDGREALLEVYTVTRDTRVNWLGNMSVLASDAPLILGFVADGRGDKRVLIRAVGPGLVPFGVQNVMSDPKIAIFNNRGQQIAENDDWGTDPLNGGFFARSGAFPLAPGSKDAAVSLVLPIQGTMSISAVGQGEATNRRMLVELFDVP